jgi:hypothetical protein
VRDPSRSLRTEQGAQASGASDALADEPGGQTSAPSLCPDMRTAPFRGRLRFPVVLQGSAMETGAETGVRNGSGNADSPVRLGVEPVELLRSRDNSSRKSEQDRRD